MTITKATEPNERNWGSSFYYWLNNCYLLDLSLAVKVSID